MESKTCPNCGNTSYSAGAIKWICPYCKKDISDVKINESLQEQENVIYIRNIKDKNKKKL
jgi:tRNA(Ile2) C34 agmatinyltransferase TiaS